MPRTTFRQYFSTALRIHAGPDSLASLERELGRVGAQRAAIVCTRSLAASGLLDQVRCGAGGRCAATIVGAEAHSPLAAVARTSEELRALDADAVIAVGGGSAVVTARAAALLLAEHGDIESLANRLDPAGRFFSPRLDAPKLPQFVVPTTPNTAMVKAGSAVFDPARGRRLALFDPKTRAQAVFVHPALSMSAPHGLVVAASLDTLTLAVEGLMSPRGDPISEGLLIHAIRLLHSGLARMASGDSAEIRTQLTMAAVLCGRGTDHTGAGMSTAIGHAAGARHGLDNGRVKAVVLSHVLRFNAAFAQEAIAMVAAALGITASGEEGLEQVIAAFRRLFGDLEVPSRLRDLAIARDAWDEVAALCMEDWFLQGNPRPVVSADDIAGVIEAAW